MSLLRLENGEGCDAEDPWVAPGQYPRNPSLKHDGKEGFPEEGRGAFRRETTYVFNSNSDYVTRTPLPR